MRLTTYDIQRMKKANSVVARYSAVTGVHTLELNEEDRSGHVVHSYNVDVSNSVVDHWRREGEIKRIDAVLLHTRHQESWETILNIVRAGDIVRLKWVIGNNTQTMDEHGLYQDTVYLWIERPAKNGDPTKSKNFYLPLVDEVKTMGTRMVRYMGDA